MNISIYCKVYIFFKIHELYLSDLFHFIFSGLGLLPATETLESRTTQNRYKPGEAASVRCLDLISAFLFLPPDPRVSLEQLLKILALWGKGWAQQSWTLLLGTPASLGVMPRFEFLFSLPFQLPAHVHPGRQQVREGSSVHLGGPRLGSWLLAFGLLWQFVNDSLISLSLSFK